MHILLIFIDGIGLGEDNPETNPFAIANTPTLHALANGHRWLASTGQQVSERAIFLPTDAQLGIEGRPQSGTNQAVILTGKNVPNIIGRHYGPKPSAETRNLLEGDNFFKTMLTHDKTAALINAYPPRLHYDINRGKTLRSSYQHAVHVAGLPMFTEAELYSGDAMSEDWTGKGWHKHLGYTDTPIYTPHEAGQKMVELSRRYDFAMFSHWFTDVIGHRGTLQEAVNILELFDAVMQGALHEWDDEEGLIIITSDHGNMEHIGSRKHTENEVPTVVIGAEKHLFAENFRDLTHITPRMTELLLSQQSDTL